MKNTLQSFAFLGAIIALTGCELQEEFVVQPDGSVTKITRALLEDSFERDSISGSSDAAIRWRGFIWDWGAPVVGTSGANVAAVIVGSDVLGEASHGDKALYFYGRDGHSVHDIHLITQTFDLTEASEVELSFDYLTFSLNDSADVSDGVDEYLRVQVCSGAAEACGVGDTLNPGALKDGPWQTVFISYGAEIDNSLNGKNHKAEDWAPAKITMDIKEFSEKDHFTFRVSARMRDGFYKNKMKNRMEDGAAIDNIKAVGVSYETSVVIEPPVEIPENPPVDPPTCDDDLPFTDPESCAYIPVEVEV